MLGELYSDTLTFLGPGVVIHEQSICVASETPGHGNRADGILGLGPVALTAETLVDEPTTLIPTVIDNLLSQGDIDQRVISYFFAPTLENEVTYGTITFGGINPPDHTGSIAYT